jgi:hypothetical protein
MNASKEIFGMEIKTLLVSGLIALLPTTVHAITLDQRDPNYQKSIEHYARAQAALRVAMREVKMGEAYYQQPGIRLIPMLAPLQEFENTLEMILIPEKRRHEYQTLTPDSEFFYPSPLKEGF